MLLLSISQSPRAEADRGRAGGRGQPHPGPGVQEEEEVTALRIGTYSQSAGLYFRECIISGILIWCLFMAKV